MRFCVTCGQSLVAAPPGRLPDAPPARGHDALMKTMPEPPKFEPPPLSVGPSADPIPAARVVELGATARPPAQRVCPRCRGASDAAGAFCRFCGAQLGDAPPAVPQPSPNPIAAAAAPVPSPAPLAPVAAPPYVAPAPVAPSPVASPPVRAPAAQAAPSRARLVLVGRDGAEGPSYPLGESTDIGRAEGHIVVAEDKYMSPRHARIAQRQGAFTLRDLESTNGVFVRIPFTRSGAQVPHRGDAGGPDGAAKEAAIAVSSEQELLDQDLFLVGQQVIRFEVVKSADEGFGVASENGTLLFGTPASPRYARLCQRTVEGVVRDVFHVRKPETVIGREQGDIVFTDDPFLSRRHCMLRVAGGAGGAPRSFAIADLGSSNGTFLQVRDEVRLRSGDHFRIGQQLFRFET